MPTIVFADGSTLVEPSNAELAAKLGLKTAASRTHSPVIVVGGGPDGTSRLAFSDRLRQQTQRFGVELLQAQNVVSVSHNGLYHIIATDCQRRR